MSPAVKGAVALSSLVERRECFVLAMVLKEHEALIFVLDVLPVDLATSANVCIPLPILAVVVLLSCVAFGGH